MISGSRIWRERENFLFDARQWRTAGTADWSLRNSQISHGRTRRFGRIRFGLNFFEHILRAPRRRVYVKFFYEFSLCIHTNLLGHNFYFWVFLNKLNKKADTYLFNEDPSFIKTRYDFPYGPSVAGRSVDSFPCKGLFFVSNAPPLSLLTSWAVTSEVHAVPKQ